MELRKPSTDEQQLIAYLVNKAPSIAIAKNWSETLFVLPMEDGGMGSLRLFPEGRCDIQQEFGYCISDCTFTDTDSVKVIASLNVDEKGQLFELDIWKTDFSPLVDFSGFRKLRENP